jgi:hypothetical protein
MRSHEGAHPTGSLIPSHLFNPFSLILSSNWVKLGLLDSEQREEHYERGPFEKNQVWSTEGVWEWERWWYSLRHMSTRLISAAWIAWGLPVCCGCLSTNVGSTEARLRARETREKNEIPWLPLHVGKSGFLLLIYSRFLTIGF